MKVAIVDLETTGVDPRIHEIIDLGAVIFDSKNPGEYETIDLKVRPLHIERADPAALAVNGYDEGEWVDNAIDLNEALGVLQRKASGAVFMSYNVTFDWAFIYGAYRKSILRNPFNYHKLCLMTFAWAKMPQAGSLKLKDMCTALGIEPEDSVHRALNGAMASYHLYRKLSGT